MSGPVYSVMPPNGPSQSNLVCGGCQSLLMYPQGAAHVRCSRCGHVTPAPYSSGADHAQIVCNGCRTLLSYPQGAPSVQCTLCHAVTQVPVYGHMACHGCRIMLMFPIGAHVVKCSVCHCITPVTADNVTYEAPQPPASSGHAHQQQQQQAPVMAKPTQTVVVENPPTVDDKGNEVANIAVGVKSDP